MLRKILTLSFLYLLLCINVFAQKTNLFGVIVNVQDSTPLAYAALGVKGKEVGGITNEKGEFNFLEPDSLLNNNIIISSIGYDDQELKILDLIKSHRVKMKPKEILLSEVSITSKPYKHKIIGKEKRPFLTYSHMFDDDNPAVEQGTIFNIPNTAIIKNYNFHIIPSSKFKELKFKLNIYGISDKLPDKQLLNQTILFSVSQVGWYNLDLTPYHIEIRGYKQIAITCQLLNIEKLDSVPFSFGISAYSSPNKWILTRNRSQSEWYSKSGVLLANCGINYLNDNSINSDATDENIEALSQEYKDLIEVFKNSEKATESGFGNNDSTGRFINLKDAKIYYEVYGTGYPLVLLQGNRSEISAFFKQIPELSNNYQVIAIDTRGQGKSLDYSTGKLRYEQFAEDLKQILDSLKLKKVNILGWSDGGNTALIMSYLYPEYVNKFIAVGAVLNPYGVEDDIIERLKKEMLEIDLNAGTNSFDSRMKHLLLEEPNISQSDIKKITSLGLVIVGDRDIVKTEHTNLIVGAIANCQLKILEDASHYVPQEKSEIFNKVVLDFLGD
ncbi:MAG: alpha/beta fold hydrolase [Breznakibacter sp.]|nr:alpha/beta fold hydrolase [Breznakibacter sp.]